MGAQCEVTGIKQGGCRITSIRIVPVSFGVLSRLMRRDKTMKTVSWLAAIFCIAMLVSCASYIPTDSTVGNMSAKEARKVVATGLKEKGYVDVRFTSKTLYAAGLMYKGHLYSPTQITFSELTEIVQSGANENLITVRGATQFYIERNPRAFTNALYVLKQNAIKSKKDAEQYDASFTASLTGNRKIAAANAALPEEANKHKVQAEGAVRDKEFNDAADYYAAALKIAPWWPVGHFNRALVLGEAGDYEIAKREMNYYLQLVPDAPNARAAQDKIYDWERQNTK